MTMKTPLVMGYEVVIASDMQLLRFLYEVGWAEIQVEGEGLTHTHYYRRSSFPAPAGKSVLKIRPSIKLSGQHSFKGDCRHSLFGCTEFRLW